MPNTRCLLPSIFLVITLLSGCQAPPPTPTPTKPAPIPPTTPESPAVEVVAAWDFAAGREALGWKPTHDLARFSFGVEGLQTRAVGGDPYMVGPAIKLDAAAASHLEIRMRSTKGADGQVFWEAGGKSFNETASQHFAVIADGEWHTYRLDLKDHSAW